MAVKPLVASFPPVSVMLVAVSLPSVVLARVVNPATVALPARVMASAATVRFAGAVPVPTSSVAPLLSWTVLPVRIRPALAFTCAMPSTERVPVVGSASSSVGRVKVGGLEAPVAAVTSALTLLLCWRFAGAGFGDVRLATLGGLGLGHATVRGLLLALGAFALISLIQAGVALARAGDRRALVPYGPPLAVGFLLAATF